MKHTTYYQDQKVTIQFYADYTPCNVLNAIGTNIYVGDNKEAIDEWLENYMTDDLRDEIDVFYLADAEEDDDDFDHEAWYDDYKERRAFFNGD